MSALTLTADRASLGGRARRLLRSSVLWTAGQAALLVVLSLFTVLRHTVNFLQADGVEQSVMSIQDVDLFFWGQNRFAAFVSLIASPIADPDANLFACLLINALAFHGLLLLLAHMGVHAIAGRRDRWSVTVVFLVITAVAHAVITPAALHIMALESQPYSASLLLTMGSFLLWKQGRGLSAVASATAVGVAMGLNQSTVLVAAFLAAVQMVRTRQWWRWPSFGAVWVAWFAVWAWLSARFGGNAGPIPDAPQNYFAFDPHQFVVGSVPSAQSVLDVFQTGRALAVLVVACLFLLLLHDDRRILAPRFGAGAVFAACYWAVFAGNPWVAANGYVFRYFYPVVLFVVLCLATPLAALAVGLWRNHGVLRITLRPLSKGGPRGQRMVTTAALVACGATLVGPLGLPSAAPVLVESRPTADWIRANSIEFVSGYYWDMWPILHRTLEDGRQAVHVTAFKSGGDPASYLRAFDEARHTAAGPRAVCVNDDVAACETYLDYWTKPGWRPTGESCPVPGATPRLGGPAVRQCVVLAYDGI